MVDHNDDELEREIDSLPGLPKYPPAGASYFWQDHQGWWWGNDGDGIGHIRGPWLGYDDALADYWESLDADGK